ncbi:hypothetical protein DJ018_08785 [Phenylobacterium deserti]|uniref:Uncharacterized protein n=1 Tax=Phenylobacterium deserti TaxID=1914756 RepID=A0A328ATQ5_9CAUL|nr:hypothetical protein DJ018_08785 [Phenylobacterium deserti]
MRSLSLAAPWSVLLSVADVEALAPCWSAEVWPLAWVSAVAEPVVSVVAEVEEPQVEPVAPVAADPVELVAGAVLELVAGAL